MRNSIFYQSFLSYQSFQNQSFKNTLLYHLLTVAFHTSAFQSNPSQDSANPNFSTSVTQSTGGHLVRLFNKRLGKKLDTYSTFASLVLLTPRSSHSLLPSLPGVPPPIHSSPSPSPAVGYNHHSLG